MTTAPLEHREEQAKREIGHTRVGRPTAVALVAAFLLILVAVPVVDLAAGRVVPLFADFARGVPPSVATIAGGSLVTGNRSLLAAMNRLEDDLEEGSAVAEAIQQTIARIPNTVDVRIKQGKNYPELHMNVDRTKAAYYGITQDRVIVDVITGISSPVRRNSSTARCHLGYTPPQTKCSSASRSPSRGSWK